MPAPQLLTDDSTFQMFEGAATVNVDLFAEANWEALSVRRDTGKRRAVFADSPEGRAKAQELYDKLTARGLTAYKNWA